MQLSLSLIYPPPKIIVQLSNEFNFKTFSSFSKKTKPNLCSLLIKPSLFYNNSKEDRRMNAMERTDRPLTSKEVTNRLNIGDSTLRKWCLALEEHEYTFYRTDQNKRMFTQQDLIVLQHFQKLVQVQNMSMNNASLIVTSKFKKEPFSNGTEIEQSIHKENSVPALRSDNEVIERLMNYIEQQEEHRKHQEEFNKKLLQRLEEQQKYIDERLKHGEEREKMRDEALMKSLRETQETKKLIAAAEEKREEEKKEENQKSFWQKLFGN